jgi:phospholipid transport system substrate-binding protein
MVDAVKRRSAALTALVVLAPLLLFAGRPGATWAGEPTDAMQDFFAAVNLVLNDPRTEGRPLERLRAIRRHVDELFDFREAAVLALGREWSARTALEQNEFVALFADLLERSFVWRVAGKAALGGGVKVQYVGETVDGDVATVDTAVTARDGSDIRLAYRMVQRAGRWVVRDVVMDGVSTMQNYHAQFQRVVRDTPWRDLMGQLRAKVGTSGEHVAPAPGPAPRPATMVAGSAPSEHDAPGPEDRRAIVRDLAAVVTPGLAVRDVAALPPLPPPAPARGTGLPGATPVMSTSAPARVAVLAAVPDSHSIRGDVHRGTGAETSRTIRGEDGSRTAPAEPVAPSTPRLGAGSPAPLAVAVPPGAAPSPATTFWVQVGAYRNASTAGKVADRVRGEIFLAPPTAAGEPLLRVRVGPFASRAHAVARLGAYRSLGYRPFVATD